MSLRNPFRAKSYSEQMRARLEAQGVRYVRLSAGDAVPILTGIPDRELPAIEAVDEIDEARRLLKPLGYEPFVVLDGSLRAGVEPGPVFFLSRRNAAHFINFDWH